LEYQIFALEFDGTPFLNLFLKKWWSHVKSWTNLEDWGGGTCLVLWRNLNGDSRRMVASYHLVLEPYGAG
jgi:hypothetical protein